MWWATNSFCICAKLMRNFLNNGIKNENIPLNMRKGLTEMPDKANNTEIVSNQILLSGISAKQLVDLLRPMVREEVRLVFSELEEKLLSPSETCKLFIPAITKATLTSWTEKGWLQDHRIGGRVYYLKSEVLASTLKLGKYKSIYEKCSA